MTTTTHETISPELLRKFDVAGPRYASYPTADRFVEAGRCIGFNRPSRYSHWWRQRANAASTRSMSTSSTACPHQSPESFDRTLEQVVRLRLVRIALYAYAHLPERFRPQRRIVALHLPDTTAKVRMLARSLSTLTGAGYRYVGMDHFALPYDPLAVAKPQGRSRALFSRIL